MGHRRRSLIRSRTLKTLEEICSDYRTVFQLLANPSGNTAELKGYLCADAGGDRLDHMGAFVRLPEHGVTYTDWAEQYMCFTTMVKTTYTRYGRAY